MEMDSAAEALRDLTKDCVIPFTASCFKSLEFDELVGTSVMLTLPAVLREPMQDMAR